MYRVVIHHVGIFSVILWLILFQIHPWLLYSKLVVTSTYFSVIYAVDFVSYIVFVEIEIKGNTLNLSYMKVIVMNLFCVTTCFYITSRCKIPIPQSIHNLFAHTYGWDAAQKVSFSFVRGGRGGLSTKTQKNSRHFKSN